MALLNELIAEYKTILKEAVANDRFRENSCCDFFSPQLINRIRSIKEELTNNLKEMMGTTGVIYRDLIGRYGMKFRQRASGEEMVRARDKFRKEGLEDYEGDVENIFKRMKFRVLSLVISQYMALLKSKRKWRLTESF